MRSCDCGCVRVQRGVHEILSVSRSGCICHAASTVTGRHFQGQCSDPSSLPLFSVIMCACVCLLVRPFPENHHDQRKGPPSSITHCPRSHIYHHLHSEQRPSSWLVADIHNMSGTGLISDQSKRFHGGSVSGQRLKQPTR